MAVVYPKVGQGETLSSPHPEERALARISKDEEFAAILRDAAKRPLLRMRSSV